MTHKPSEHAKQPHSTKRGPGRYHKDGHSHGRAMRPGMTGSLDMDAPSLKRPVMTALDLQPQRLNGESQSAYRERRARANRMIG